MPHAREPSSEAFSSRASTHLVCSPWLAKASNSRVNPAETFKKHVSSQPAAERTSLGADKDKEGKGGTCLYLGRQLHALANP